MLLALIALLVSRPKHHLGFTVSGFYYSPTPMIIGARVIKISRDMSLRPYVYLDFHGNWRSGWIQEFKF